MDMELGTAQSRFADIIWESEPVSSGDLVKICRDRFSWKKTTTYTVLHNLCEKGLFLNEGGIVTSCLSREEYYTRKGETFLRDGFSGSLPAFISAFASRKRLSEKDLKEIARMIDAYRKGD